MRGFLLVFAALPIAAVAQSSLTITTPPSLPAATVNQAYSTQISATGGTTPYQWHFQSGGSPSPRLSMSSSGVLSGTPTQADLGVVTLYIQVTDANSVTVTKQFSLTVQSTQTLTITTSAFPPGVVGVPYSLQLTGSGGTPPYKWNVLPAVVTFPVPGRVSPGLTLDSTTGIVSGSPTSAGSFSFTITLTDSANGSSSKPYTVTITPGGPLGVTTASLPGATVGASYSQTLQASGGVPPYKWLVAAGSLPAGLTLDAGGTISGAPTSAGSSDFTAQATDSASNPGTARQALTITVVTPPPLSITTSSLPGGTRSAPYSQKLAATGGVTPYTWAVATGSLPAGLSLGAKTGIIDGTPTATGSSDFTIQVTDGAAGKPATAMKSYTIAIAELTPLSVNGGDLPAGSANTPYSHTLPANGGAPPYTWTVAAGSLPPGLLLSSSGTLSGVPTVAGTFAFTGQVTDTTGGSALGAFSVSLAAATLSITTFNLPSAVAGAAYPSQIFTATGGAPPYTFSVTGTLPAGMSLANGALTGTPTSTGTSNFSIKVTDAVAATASATAQLIVRSALPPDLVLSAGSLAFSLAAGAADVPEPRNFTVTSSNATTVLGYQISVSPAATWLAVSGVLNATASTPGGISVALTGQALTLAASATPYSTTITVTCQAPSPCAGSAQSVPVTLTVSAPPPQLLLTKTVVSLATAANSQTSATGRFGIQNAGGGSIEINSATAADDWLSVGGVPATLSPGPAVSATVTANASGLAPGLYRSSIAIATSAGNAILPVTLLISANLTMTLNPVGQQFQMSAAGAAGNPNGSLQVLVSGGVTANWSAAVLPGSNWLTVKTASGTSTPSAPGSVAFSIDSAASAALSAGSYYGRIRVTSSQVTNTPQDFLVVLNVAAAGTSPDPDPQPSGLLFISNGTTPVPAQNLTLYASSTSAVAYQAAAMTTSGTSWLTVTPTSGTASASNPGRPTVSVSPAGLAAGVYRGVVTYQFSSSAVRSVNVTYIVPVIAGGLPFARPGAPALTPHAGGSCTPGKLVLTATGVPANFVQPVSWPTALSVLLTDDCGTGVGNGIVDVTFDNGDSPVVLAPDATNAGRYVGTWTPRGPVPQVTLTANAIAAGLTAARLQITGKVAPNVAPSLTPGATLNVFNPLQGGGIAPGTAVQIYGSNFAPTGTAMLASSVPFPTSMANVSVLIGGVAAPLYFVSPGQINAQAPFELMPGVPYQIVVNANGALTTPDGFVAAPATPGIAAFANGSIIAQHLDFSLVTDASPAKPGETLIIYPVGLGTTANQPVTGAGSPVPPTGPVNTVTLLFNGNSIPVAFVGLTPGAVGLYQIAFAVPAASPDGPQTLTITQAGSSSNVTIVLVHR